MINIKGLLIIVIFIVYVIIFIQIDFYIFGFLNTRKLDESSIICNISGEINGDEKDSLISDVDSTKRIQFIN